MAATEKMMSSLQQSSSAMGSSTILSFKPFHPSYDFGRSSYRKLIPSVQASAAGKEDRGATLSKSHEESSSRSSSVSSLLKAVQEGGSSVVLQQVSSIRHFFMPELPQALIREIKKRMALPFKDQDDEENSIQEDLNGGLLKEEEQMTLLGPRCAWPRLKLVNAEGERQEEAKQGPRCAWPRAAQALRSSRSLQQWKQEEGIVTCMSSLEEHQNGGILSKSSQEGLEREGIVNNSVIEGPRCAWPRSTPRRMLATGVGLSLMNYLLIGQGAPALAILFPITCDEESSLSSPLQSLLP